MASLLGSVNNCDMGCHLATMIASVDDVARCGAREGLPRAHAIVWMELQCVRGWSYGMWMVARWRARGVARRDRLMLIEEEAREVAKWGLQ